jgi:hypothetical protein
MEVTTIDKLPEVEELTNDDLFAVDQAAVTKSVKLEKVNDFIQTNTIAEVKELLEAEAEARIQGDENTLEKANEYTDREITKNKLAVNEWLAPVKTVSQIPLTGLDNTRNYLIKVVADQNSGVYQAVAGWEDEPEWVLYDNTVDLVDEEELEAAISEHNTDNEAHEDIRAVVKKIDDDYVTSGDLGKAVSELETSLTETANNFEEALYYHNNSPASHNAILEAIKKIDDDYVNETGVTDIVNGHNQNKKSHIDIRDIISNHIGIPEWDSDNYILTFTAENGVTLEVDIPLESLATGLDFDPSTKELVITRQDGSEIRISVADLIEVYEGSTGTHIQITVESGNVIKAALLSGSITENELSDGLLAKINDKTAEIDLTGLETAISNLDEKTVKLADVGQPNGVASLDEQAKVPLAQLPAELTGLATVSTTTDLAENESDLTAGEFYFYNPEDEDNQLYIGGADGKARKITGGLYQAKPFPPFPDIGSFVFVRVDPSSNSGNNPMPATYAVGLRSMVFKRNIPDGRADFVAQPWGSIPGTPPLQNNPSFTPLPGVWELVYIRRSIVCITDNENIFIRVI